MSGCQIISIADNIEIMSNSENKKDEKFLNLLETANVLKNAGKSKRNYNCWYYYGQEDSRLWWDKPYYEALLIKRKLAQQTIDLILEDHYLVRDSNRINRISRAISDIDKMLSDNPKLSKIELFKAQFQYKIKEYKTLWIKKLEKILYPIIYGYFLGTIKRH